MQQLVAYFSCLSSIARSPLPAKTWPISYTPLLQLHNQMTHCGAEEEVYKKLARYCLGKPSKQYAPWYEPVLKTVRLAEDKDQETFKGGRNVGLKAYVVCQLLEIEVSKEQGSAKSTKIKVQRIFSHEDISVEKAYCSDIQEVYYGEQVLTVPIIGTEGKCDIRKKHDLPSMDSPITFEHIFFCEHLYGSDKAGAIKQFLLLVTLKNLDDQLPANIKLSLLKERVADDAIKRKEKDPISFHKRRCDQRLLDYPEMEYHASSQHHTFLLFH
ncbi:hypothetical protein Q3G72_003099 [Acer saccharum]|nr:hypothetical protein Q3G72_003099 [Acer saccharum]